MVRKDGTDGPAIELEDALDYHIGRRNTLPSLTIFCELGIERAADTLARQVR